MKTERMSFNNIKDVLSRDEMKKIMAGSGEAGCGNCKGTSTACAAGPVTGTCICGTSDKADCVI